MLPIDRKKNRQIRQLAQPSIETIPYRIKIFGQGNFVQQRIDSRMQRAIPRSEL